ncbi:ATP-binding protein [Virgibacillus saliphilus]|uniref:ATP-binding protein n=1 Tax=Virgibacillus saliphilus TaxID=2831674 RepID=UPI002106DD7E|nr:AAA family ATPase [Virgibacillus sp. NKC19-3]
MHATIYGFGKWVDYDIDFTSESVQIIYGENESGKTTLQKFILFMLFGLPPKQRAFYRPKTSGKMGGRLTIVDPIEGTYTIERLDEVRNGAAICFTDDGQEHDETWLKDRLNGMTYSTYQSIFSFSAFDLHALTEMKEDDFGEVLLGIGLTGSNNIYAIEKKLDNQIGELFKPYGKKPVMNQQLEVLNERFKHLHTFQAEEAQYREKKAKAASLTDEINTLHHELQQEKKNLLSIEKHQHALPIIHDYHHCSKQLASYPADIDFPENGVDRLEKVNEKLLPLTSELAAWEDNQKQYQEKISALKEELENKSVHNHGQELLRKKEQYKQNEKDLERLQAAIHKKDMQINAGLDELNIALNAVDLASIEFPFYIEKTWNQLKNDADQLHLEEKQLQQERNQAKQQRNYVINQQQELEEGLLTEERYHELHEKINEQKEHDVLQKLKRYAADKRNEWEEIKQATDKKSRNLLLASILFSLLAGIGGIITNSIWIFYLIPLFVIIGIGGWLWGRSTITNIENMLLQENPQAPAMQATDEEREEAERLLALHDKYANELQSLKEQLKAIDIQFIQWDEKRRIHVEREEELNARIAAQHETYPFLRDIEISYWPECFHHLRRLLNLDQERRHNDREFYQLQVTQEEIRQEANAFLQSTKWETPATTMDDAFATIERLINTYQTAMKQLENYENLIAENRQQQRALKQKMRTYEKEITALLDIAQVESIDAFYKKAKQLEEKQEIEATIKQSLEQLSVTFSQAALKQALEENNDQDTMEIMHQQSQSKIDQVELNINEKRHQLAEINATLKTLESSESLSETAHRFQMETEYLNKQAKQWAIVKTAKEMLIETKRNYRNKYINRVIDQATHYFEKITGNAYIKIYAPTANRPFQVEANDHLRYTVNELSQGTIDQLYIALRIAISEIMSDRHQLPFIIDDAFVHFDTMRTNRIMEIMEEIAKEQQMIIFTCKDEVVECSKSAEIMRLGNTVRINE